MEKSERGKRKIMRLSVCIYVCVCVIDKVAILNWKVRECVIERTTFEKNEEASFVDMQTRAFLAVEPSGAKVLDKKVSSKFE